MRIEVLTGAALEAALDDLARLRIEVFRAFPYLYDGDDAYERHYLRPYRDTPRAVVIVARDNGRAVGAATGMSLADHGDAAQMTGQLPAVEDVFYCAESVLLPEYRGQGIGHRFFDLREDHARRLGRAYSAFCGVVRPADHPLRPPGYTPLDGFWRKRGYVPVTGAVARFRWKDIDCAQETEKPLQVWMRAL